MSFPSTRPRRLRGTPAVPALLAGSSAARMSGALATSAKGHDIPPDALSGPGPRPLGRRPRPTAVGACGPVVPRVGAGQAEDDRRGWRILAARLSESRVPPMLLHSAVRAGQFGVQAGASGRPALLCRQRPVPLLHRDRHASRHGSGQKGASTGQDRRASACRMAIEGRQRRHSSL
jgi:hypothetical protein